MNVDKGRNHSRIKIIGKLPNWCKVKNEKYKSLDKSVNLRKQKRSDYKLSKWHI